MDYGYALKFAELAKNANSNYFGLLTSTSADRNSLRLYSRTKGEIELAVLALKIPRTGIFRPGLIDRGENARLGEKMVGGQCLSLSLLKEGLVPSPWSPNWSSFLPLQLSLLAWCPSKLRLLPGE